MAKRCKHEWIHVTKRDGSASGETRANAMWLLRLTQGARSARCADCREQMVIGPSNDAPVAVQIEIRAAEIMAPRRAVCVVMSSSEEVGWNAHYDHEDHTASQRPGWLAHELATHDDRETRDADAWSWDSTRPVAGQYEEYIARITEQTRHDVAAAAARHAELAEFERQRAEEPDPRDEDEEPGDHIDQLCELVKEAGGTMRLYGEPVTAEQLRGAVTESLVDRLAGAAAGPQTCTPDSCAPSCPARVRSEDPASVDETGGAS